MKSGLANSLDHVIQSINPVALDLIKYDLNDYSAALLHVVEANFLVVDLEAFGGGSCLMNVENALH